MEEQPSLEEKIAKGSLELALLLKQKDALTAAETINTTTTLREDVVAAAVIQQLEEHQKLRQPRPYWHFIVFAVCAIAVICCTLYVASYLIMACIYYAAALFAAVPPTPEQFPVLIPATTSAPALPSTMSSAAVQTWLERAAEPQQQERNFVLYPLHPVSGERCTPVALEMLSSTRITDVRLSLVHHIREKDYDFACAQHVGLLLCLCIMQLRGDSVPAVAAAAGNDSNTCLAPIEERTSAPPLLDIFNLRLQGYSSNRIVSNREASLYCTEDSVARRRYDRVWGSFTSLDGAQYEREFRGGFSYSLQQILELQSGMPPCRDNLDELAKIIRAR